MVPPLKDESGYAILVWDERKPDFSMINARLHDEDGVNWWKWRPGVGQMAIPEKHDLNRKYGWNYQVVWMNRPAAIQT